MILHKSNHTTVYAIQVAKYKLMNGDLKNHFLQNITIASDHADVITVEGIKRAKLGDWIIKTFDDQLFVVSGALFTHLYHKF